MKNSRLRQELVRTARCIHSAGLGIGTAGNVSTRAGDGFLITPSGVAYDVMRARDMVAMDLEGNVVSGSLPPSSEWRFHRRIYAGRPDAGAVVHTHSSHATALACLGRDIPAFHYMVAVAGGDSIRCAPYATFGSEQLARYALGALRNRRACLLAHHGQIALGDDLPQALDLAREVEELARQYWLASQLGSPIALRRGEMKKVLARFRNYGRRTQGPRRP